MQIQSMTFKEEIICFPNLINHETFITGHLTGQAIQQTALEHAHLPTSLPSPTCWRVEVLFHRLHHSTTNPNGEPEFLCSPSSSERVFYEAIVLGIGKEGLCSSHHSLPTHPMEDRSDPLNPPLHCCRGEERALTTDVLASYQISKRYMLCSSLLHWEETFITNPRGYFIVQNPWDS